MLVTSNKAGRGGGGERVRCPVREIAGERAGIML